MAFYAQYGNTGEVGQDELRQKRRVTETLKEIEGCHATMMNSLSIWMRHSCGGSQQTAEQALQGVVNARSEQNRLLRQILGVDEDRLAIGKR